MTESLVRPESWISEVLRINSHFGGINELEFGYSQLYSIVFKFLEIYPPHHLYILPITI